MIDPYADTKETEPVRARNGRQRGEQSQLNYKARISPEYKRLRSLFRAACARHRNPDGTLGAHCWIGNHPINYGVAYPDPQAWTLDHALPVRDHPELMMDPMNFRAACWNCNIARGAGPLPIDGDLGEASEEW